MKKKVIGLLLLAPVFALSQNIYEKYENLVNPFNGDVNFTERVISIESSNGKSYPINLSYNSNIGTNQRSSWVGLGFSLVGGEITRVPNGGADDVGGISDIAETTEQRFLNGDVKKSKVKNIYGPMYPKPSPTVYVNNDEVIDDLEFSNTVSGSAVVFKPAFDQFHLNTGLFSGSFSLINPPIANGDLAYPKENEHYSEPVYRKSQGSAVKYTFNDDDGNAGNSNPGEYSSYAYNLFQFDNDPTCNNYIKYYKKSDNATISDGYVKYKDENGNELSFSGSYGEKIIAFTVYLEDGYKLHFSLPVFDKHKRTYSLKVRDDGSGLSSTDTIYQMSSQGFVPTSWKLTAITGPNFEDVNANGIADSGDKGYWLRFYYSMGWFDDVIDKFPYHGAIPSSGFRGDVNVQGRSPKYHNSGIVTISEEDECFIEKIESDIQTLIFYKDLRRDDFYYKTGYEGIPNLCLSSIVKYGQSNVVRSKAHAVSGASYFPVNINSVFNTYRNSIYLEDDYQYESDIILQRKEFQYDYSQCPGYYNNIDNYLNANTAVFDKNSYVSTIGYHDIIKPAKSSYVNSGKLTLLGVRSYEFNAVNVFEDLQFSYSAQLNKVYKPEDCDLFGNYLPMSGNLNGCKYNPKDKPVNQSAAWALSSVRYPSGVKVNFNYENDEYVTNKSASESPSRGNTLFPIKSMKPISIRKVGNNDIAYLTLEIELFDFVQQKEFLEGLSQRLIQFKGSFSQSYMSPNCSGCSAGTSTVVRNFTLKGMEAYIDETTRTANSYMTITQNTSNLTVECIVYDDGDPGFDWCSGTTCSFCERGCWGSINMNAIPSAYQGYFSIKDEFYVGGGARVSEIEIDEAETGSNSSYKIAYEYLDGYTGSVPAPYYVRDDTLRSGSGNTSLNSLPSVVGYGEIIKSYLSSDNRVKEKIVYDYDFPMNSLLNIYSSFNVDLDRFLIPSLQLNQPISNLWYLMDKGYEFHPLVECYIRSLVHESVLANNPSLSYSDVEEIRDRLPSETVNECWDLNQRSLYSRSLYCMDGFVTGNGLTMSYLDNSPPSGVNQKYFPYDNAENAYKYTGRYILDGEIHDSRSLWGRVRKIENYDELGSKTSEVQFLYENSGTLVERYTMKAFPPSGTSYYSYKTKYKREYFTPKITVLYSKGGSGLTVNKALDRYSGKVKRAESLERSKGVVESTFDYRDYSDESYLRKKSPVRLQANTTYNNDTVRYSTNYQHSIYNGIYIPSGFTEREGKINYTQKQRLAKKLFGIEKIGNYLTYEKSSTYLNQDVVENIFLESGDSYKVLGIDGDGFRNIETVTSNAPLLLGLGQNIYSTTNTLVGQNRHTLYSSTLVPLETYNDLNKTYSSIKLSEPNGFVIASVENCRYGSFTHCGFEYTQTGDYMEGDIYGSSTKYLPTSNDISVAHTGKYVSKIGPSDEVFYFVEAQNPLQHRQLEVGRTYVASVWVNTELVSGNPYIEAKLNGSLDGGTTLHQSVYRKYFNDATNITVGNWRLLELEFTVPSEYRPANEAGEGPGPGETFIFRQNDGWVGPNGNNNYLGFSKDVNRALKLKAMNPPTGSGYDPVNKLTISLNSPTGVSYFDDLKFQPVDANVNVKIYDPVRRLITEEIDNQNFFTRMVYDAAGRVLEMHKETPDGVKIMQQNTYQD